MRWLVFVLGIALASCAAPTPQSDVPDGPLTHTIYLIRRGWHTDIAMDADQVAAPLNQLRLVFPGVRTFSIGFGERAWLVHRQHDLADMHGDGRPATFGSGPHGCPGAAHATTIARQVVAVLAAEGWRPAPGQRIELERRPNVRVPVRILVTRP